MTRTGWVGFLGLAACLALAFLVIPIAVPLIIGTPGHILLIVAAFVCAVLVVIELAR